MSEKTYPSRIYIYESELEFISRCVLDYPHTETGGDFFGLWTKEGYPVIQYAIGPGDAAERTATHFNQEIEYLRECGFLLNNRFGSEHIGAWHSHHRLELSEPSQGDVNTMKNALMETAFSRFIVSICNIVEDEVAVNGFLFSNESLQDYTPCNWVILPGTSPIRESLEKTKDSLLGLFLEPETESASFYVKNTEAPDTEVTNGRVSAKPELPSNSYWTKPEGRQYLKTVYDNMVARPDLSEVELLQLADKRIAISFKHDRVAYEIRFPNSFPNTEPEVVEKVQSNNFLRIILRSGRRQKSRVRKFLDSLNIFSGK